MYQDRSDLPVFLTGILDVHNTLNENKHIPMSPSAFGGWKSDFRSSVAIEASKLQDWIAVACET